MKFKTLTTAFAATVLSIGLSTGAALADWAPSGPITLWIGFGAGGETDTLGRIIAKEVGDKTGWDVIVENKPGGGGMAMFTQLTAQAPDGQKIGMGVSMPVLVNLTLRPDEVPFDLDSFDYLNTVTLAQLAIIAKKDAPFDDLAGLIAYSKENSGALVGFDAKPQELLVNFMNAKTEAGLRPVSMKSSAEMVQNLLGGHVIAAFNAGAHIPYLESGDLKMIASANETRHSYAPETATLKEQGFDIYVDPYFYIAGPAGMPDDAKTALSAALSAAISSDAARKVISDAMHGDPSTFGPEETKSMLVNGLKNVATLFGK